MHLGSELLILNLDVSCLYASLTDKLACAMMDIPLLKLEHTDIMGVIDVEHMLSVAVFCF